MRRRFQVGCLFKRGKRRKVWVARFRQWVAEGGQIKRMQRSKIIGPVAEMTKSQAERELRDILTPVNEGTHAPDQVITFGQFAAKWESEILSHYR